MFNNLDLPLKFSAGSSGAQVGQEGVGQEVTGQDRASSFVEQGEEVSQMGQDDTENGVTSSVVEAGEVVSVC